jgi:hypothetical protein
MKSKTTITAIFVFFISVCMTIQADLTGNWAGNLTLPGGRIVHPSYTFKVDGDKLTGTAHGPRGDTPLENPVINGSDFSFEMSNQPSTIHFTGKFYGDSTTIDFHVMDQDFHEKLLRTK